MKTLSQRSIILFLSLLIAWTLSITLPVHAAAITVNTLTDGTSLNGLCTLREAIINANNDAATHADCSSGSGGDIITFVVAGPITLGGTQMSVTSNITINEGVGNVTISGGGSSRVFFVSAASGSLTLNGLELENGSSTNAGGCILVSTSGSLTFNNGVIRSCMTTNSGGAIGTTGTVSSITLSGSMLSDNTSGINGGAIAQSGTNADLSLINTTFSNNRAGTATGAQGGAISYSGQGAGGSTFSISGGSFTSNRAQANSGTNAFGGAIQFTASDASMSGTISGVTFSGNQASGGSSANRGGAIYKTGVGSLTVSGSSFTGGSAAGGGAIYNNQGNLTVTTSRIESNTGGAYYSVSGGTDSISQSCIVGNSDTAVVDTEVANDLAADGGGNIANSNWWGTSWGPQITAVGGGSAVSNGDSISGDGFATSGDSIADVHVNLISPGTDSTAPTGYWLTTAPTVAGATCMTCSGVSSSGHARSCS